MLQSEKAWSTPSKVKRISDNDLSLDSAMHHFCLAWLRSTEYGVLYMPISDPAWVGGTVTQTDGPVGFGVGPHQQTRKP